VFQLETKVPAKFVNEDAESMHSFDTMIEFPETHVAKSALGITGKKHKAKLRPLGQIKANMFN
jgi:hypothetical protein